MQRYVNTWDELKSNQFVFLPKFFDPRFSSQEKLTCDQHPTWEWGFKWLELGQFWLGQLYNFWTKPKVVGQMNVQLPISDKSN